MADFGSDFLWNSPLFKTAAPIVSLGIFPVNDIKIKVSFASLSAIMIEEKQTLTLLFLCLQQLLCPHVGHRRCG